jgi:hypothetical protein
MTATPIPDTVTLCVSFRVVRRGGRKKTQLPDGTTQLRRTDNALVNAMARAFRWKRMLVSGKLATISPDLCPRCAKTTMVALGRKAERRWQAT